MTNNEAKACAKLAAAASTTGALHAMVGMSERQQWTDETIDETAKRLMDATTCIIEAIGLLGDDDADQSD